MERRPQEVARGVAGEHPPGPIPAVGGRGQSDDEDPGVRVAEPGERAAPVRFVTEAGDLLECHPFSPGDQARAAPAVDDLPRECLEGGEVGHVSSSLSSRRDTTARPMKPMTLR